MNSVRVFEISQGQKHENDVIYQYKQNNAIFVRFEGKPKIFENEEWNSQKYFLQFFLSAKQMVVKIKETQKVDTTLLLVLNRGN